MHFIGQGYGEGDGFVKEFKNLEFKQKYNKNRY